MAESSQPLRLSVEPGRRLPLHAGADVGKAGRELVAPVEEALAHGSRQTSPANRPVVPSRR